MEMVTCIGSWFVRLLPVEHMQRELTLVVSVCSTLSAKNFLGGCRMISQYMQGIAHTDTTKNVHVIHCEKIIKKKLKLKTWNSVMYVGNKVSLQCP